MRVASPPFTIGTLYLMRLHHLLDCLSDIAQADINTRCLYPYKHREAASDRAPS